MMEDISVQVTILLFAALVGIVIAKRAGQSAIIWQILIGILIGPTVLNLVQYNDTVKVLAELGAIFMLFTIGLECNYKEIYNFRNSFVAFFGVVIPFLAGWGLAYLFGYNTLEGLFIGTALTATSIAITARVLKDRGMISTPLAKTIIGAAVVDDVLGLIALSIITGFTGSFSWTLIGTHILVALLFIFGCILLIKPINWLMSKIDETGEEIGAHQVTIFAAFVIAFAYAGVASYIGMASIVGAFLAGVTLEQTKIKSYREGAIYFELLFSAIFFVSIGVVTDFLALSSGWIFALVLIVVAVLAKLIGCMLAARATGHTWHEALSVGIGMAPRGEVATIVAMLGLAAGVITAELYGAIVIMALVTALITPLLLGWSLPSKA
jgi:Kef-type K+ transport system membrane component KefB